MSHADKLESAWSDLCRDAGWTSALYCTPDLSARRRYEANIDALATPFVIARNVES